MANYRLKEQLNRGWVTPGGLKNKPRHRWYSFPHSFTSELVQALIDEWELGSEDKILDPFVGAGTTILAAKEKGVPASGYDLSPLAVFTTRTKIGNYNKSRLEALWKSLQRSLNPARWNGAERVYPQLVEDALPGRLLGAFDAIARRIHALRCSAAERDFFRLALLTTLPNYSRAEATGGWLKWMDKRTRITSLASTLSERVEVMICDLNELKLTRRPGWSVGQSDARKLPVATSSCSAIITSPPYPNRHDYTRVFGVELMFEFLDWEQTRDLRYQSFQSHPEARPHRPTTAIYKQPQSLTRALSRIKDADVDPRIPRMLEGYFLDMHLCLCEMRRVCRRKAKIALVLGNAQYCGQPVLVDELTAKIGEGLGLKCEKIIAVRYRGNSAQQMDEYGRNPSRESIVVFSKR
jgi:hypothetical protein